MHITSINVGKPTRLHGASFSGTTGIFKAPVDAVRVGSDGIADDAVLNGIHHGGPDQAVYVYREEDYAWWSLTLGRPVAPGTFGDNLTVAGLPAADVPVGARLSFTDVVLEVTAPRIPCNTLAQRMDDVTFAKSFMQAERPGFYCRVLHPGALVSGESFRLSKDTASDVGILAMFRATGRRLDRAELEWLLAAPIDVRTRRKLESRLAALGQMP